MKNSTLTVVLLLVIFFLAQSLSADTKPKWVTERPVNPLFYIGIGYASKTDHPGDYQKVAKDQALQDLSSEIEIKISSDFLQSLSEKAGNIKENVQSQIRSTTKAHLEGYRLVDTWENGSEYWAYYRLDKDTYKTLRSRRKAKALNLADDFFRKARQAEGQKRISSAVRLYLQALQALQEFVAEPLRVKFNGHNVYLQNEIYASLQNIFANIRLTPVNSRIQVKINKATARPLAVNCFYQTAPDAQATLSDLPVYFRFIRGAGQLEHLVTSNSHGLARATLSSVTSSDKLQIVGAETRPELFLGQKPSMLLHSMLQNLNTPKTKILLQVSGLTAYIESSEKNLGKDLKVKYIEPRLKQALSDNGFTFTDDVSGADILITIKAQTRKGAQLYNLFSSFGEMTISVTDLSSGAEIYKKAFTNLKGIQLDYTKAGLKALENAGKLAAQNIPEMMRQMHKTL